MIVDMARPWTVIPAAASYGWSWMCCPVPACLSSALGFQALSPTRPTQTSKPHLGASKLQTNAVSAEHSAEAVNIWSVPVLLAHHVQRAPKIP